MDTQTATYLAALNERFYAEHAASFSQTRGAPWEGWRRLVGELGLGIGLNGRTAQLSVLDVACGNMRFARFLEDALPDRTLSYRGIDSCDALIPPERRACFEHADLIAALLDGASAPPRSSAFPAYDLVVCFGFMHHVPGYENRAALLRRLLARARPGGAVAVSFWRFMDDPRLARKAQATMRFALDDFPQLRGKLEENDFFLGWQDAAHSYRYCHHFDEREIDALLASASGLAAPLARYRADGKSGTLNEYLILGKNH